MNQPCTVCGLITAITCPGFPLHMFKQTAESVTGFAKACGKNSHGIHKPRVKDAIVVLFSHYHFLLVFFEAESHSGPGRLELAAISLPQSPEY